MDLEHVGMGRCRPVVHGSIISALMGAMGAGCLSAIALASPDHAHTEQGAPVQTTVTPSVILAPGLSLLGVTDDIGVVDFAEGDVPDGYAPGVYASIESGGGLVRITAAGEVESFSDLLGPPLLHPVFGIDALGGLAVHRPAGDTTVLDANGLPRDALMVPPHVSSMTIGVDGAYAQQPFVIDETGVIYRFDAHTLKPIGYGPAATNAMTIGAGRGFSDAMYFADAAQSIVWRRDINGELAAWAELDRWSVTPSDLAVDAFGAFGPTAMFVLDSDRGEIYRLDAQGQLIELVATGLDDAVAITVPRQGPFAGALLIASAGRVLAVVPEGSPTDRSGP